MKILPLLASLALALIAHANTVYQDEFTGTSIPAAWNNIANAPVALDDPNNQLDYDHTASTIRRFLNFNGPHRAKRLPQGLHLKLHRSLLHLVRLRRHQLRQQCELRPDPHYRKRHLRALHQ